MRNVLKTVVWLVVLSGLWACLPYVCKEDADCFQEGSFCFKAEDQGVCTWGEWAEDDFGAWAIRPRLQFHSAHTFMDDERPKTKTVQTKTRALQVRIFVHGASNLPVPQGGNGVVVECMEAEFLNNNTRIDRICNFLAPQHGEYVLRFSAENSHGKTTTTVYWTVGTP